MKKMDRRHLIAACALLLVAALPATSHAKWMCLHARGAEVGSSTACAVSDVTTATGPHRKWLCDVTGPERLFWNTTLPTDVPAAMDWTDMRIDWVKVTATGTACLEVCAMVVKDGQDYTEDANYTCMAADDVVPTTTTTQVSVADNALVALPVNIMDAAGGDCSSDAAGCRGAPLRVRFRRSSLGSCVDDVGGEIGILKVCLEY